MEHESHHHHHPHGTGFRWLDITLGVAAAIVSLVSLWLGIHSSHSMEKLVAANSYPYLEQWRSMSMPGPGNAVGRDRVQYTFENNGVGPARIEWVQLTFKRKQMANLSELLAACCAGSASKADGLDRRGNVVGALVRPGATLSMFTWDEPGAPNPVFSALRRQMNDISIDYCYCSVFDECYLRHADAHRPEPVKACQAPETTFRPGFREDD